MNQEQLIQFFNAFKKTKKKILDLSNKDIAIVPEEISELQNLEQINLSYNKLSLLPKGICELPNLNTLLLTRNKLEAIPAEIYKLKNLKELDLSYNSLTTLPKEIGQLDELENLDASFNKMRRLPLEMVNMLSIKKLFLESNPFVFPPVDVINRGLYSTMIYLAHEKKKRDKTRIFIQVFNLPEEVSGLFEQYLNNFSSMVASQMEYKIKFDITYIEKDQ